MSNHNSVHEETYRGCTIRLERDDDPESPRDWDNLGTMFCLHRRYNLGDKLDGWHNRPGPDEYLRQIADEAVGFKTHVDDVPVEHIAAVLNKHYLILDLYLYDHSGITISCAPFSCPWDSGRVGIIHCSLKEAQANWPSASKAAGWDAVIDDWYNKGQKITLREAAKRVLEGEVEAYDAFITGDVVGYVAEDPDGETIESCWGFYPDDSDGYGKRWEYPISQAKSAIDHWCDKQDEERAEAQHWAERDTITTN